MIRKFLRDESGQDLLEYALLVALIALAAVIALRMGGVHLSFFK